MSGSPSLKSRYGNYSLREAVGRLSESTIKELQAALREQLQHPDEPTAELKRLLKEVGVEARKNGIKPEELLVAFKQMWNSLAESMLPQDAGQHERVRQKLVTLCIQAYYAE